MDSDRDPICELCRAPVARDIDLCDECLAEFPPEPNCIGCGITVEPNDDGRCKECTAKWRAFLAEQYRGGPDADDLELAEIRTAWGIEGDVCGALLVGPLDPPSILAAIKLPSWGFFGWGPRARAGYQRETYMVDSASCRRAGWDVPPHHDLILRERLWHRDQPGYVTAWWHPHEGQRVSVQDVPLDQANEPQHLWAQMTPSRPKGRPVGSGRFAGREEFKVEVLAAMETCRREGRRVTQENVGAELFAGAHEARQLRHYLNHFDMPWDDFRRQERQN